MKIAIIGYGKMGKMIEAVAKERGHTVTVRIDPQPESGADARSIEEAFSLLADSDVAIEFSHPSAVLENLKALIERKVSVVVGTTGWYDKLEELKPLIANAGIGFLMASNFSLGVNLFYKIVKEAARLIDPFDDYDVAGWEAHHNQKADSPSGTAKTLTETILSTMKRKEKAVWETLSDRPPAPEELHFTSTRVGAVPGTHSIYFDSTVDSIELTHRARSREGFAKGAVIATEWLSLKKGFFTMDDVLSH